MDVPYAPIIFGTSPLYEGQFFEPVNRLTNASSFQIKFRGKFGLRHSRCSIKICQCPPLRAGKSKLFDRRVKGTPQAPRYLLQQEYEPIRIGQKVRRGPVGILVQSRRHLPRHIERRRKRKPFTVSCLIM